MAALVGARHMGHSGDLLPDKVMKAILTLYGDLWPLWSVVLLSLIIWTVCVWRKDLRQITTTDSDQQGTISGKEGFLASLEIGIAGICSFIALLLLAVSVTLKLTQ